MEFVFHFKNGKEIRFVQPLEGIEEGLRDLIRMITWAMQHDEDGEVTLNDGKKMMTVKLSEVAAVEINGLEELD